MEKKLFQSEIKANNSLHSGLKMEKYCSKDTKVRGVGTGEAREAWASPEIRG